MVASLDPPVVESGVESGVESDGVVVSVSPLPADDRSVTFTPASLAQPAAASPNTIDVTISTREPARMRVTVVVGGNQVGSRVEREASDHAAEEVQELGLRVGAFC
jgi:hypothetical protein